MKKYVFLLASLLGISSAVAEPVEITVSEKRNTVWVMYLETFTRMQDGFSVLVAERDLAGVENDKRVYVSVMQEACLRGHGTFFARANPQSKWDAITTVTINSPSTVADVTAKYICEIGKEVDKKFPAEKRKLTV